MLFSITSQVIENVKEMTLEISPETAPKTTSINRSIFQAKNENNSDIKEQLDKIQKVQEIILNNQKKILENIHNTTNIDRILEKIIKLEKERQKDKKIIAQALIIFSNIENILQRQKGISFQNSVLKGIDEIKNALGRIYDFVEKIE